ncbi:partial Queuine tRNA-ribosyltransferase, partial [Anaerolineae bacterium]
MNGFEFRIDHKDADTRARVCTIVTPHGSISTPTLAPVGTQATVKSLTPEQIQATGTQLILANTYHLYLRPGAARIAAAGGIHKFSAIDLPIMTDSGGFQVFSLGSSIRDGVGKIANIFPGDRSRVPHNVQRTKTGNNVLVKVTDEEVVFRSHLDGSLHHFSPEKSLEVQSLIGADFVLTFDECTSPLDTYEYTRLSLERTHRWATRSVDAYHKFSSTNSQALQVVVQGGAYRDLRETSAQFCSQLPCFGYSIGGSLGRSKFDMLKVLEWTIPLLPESTPKHLLGIGEVTDIFDCVERGVDIFD